MSVLFSNHTTPVTKNANARKMIGINLLDYIIWIIGHDIMTIIGRKKRAGGTTRQGRYLQAGAL